MYRIIESKVQSEKAYMTKIFDCNKKKKKTIDYRIESKRAKIQRDLKNVKISKSSKQI